MTSLQEKIAQKEEREFALETNDFFRPLLKQIRNSVYEINKHFKSDGFPIVPTSTDGNLQEVKTGLQNLFQQNDFIYKCDVLTGKRFKKSSVKSKLSTGFMFLTESLALALSMDFYVPARPRKTIGDVFIALPHQPVLVLTIVDGDVESDKAVAYNASVASGVTMSLARFMDECVNPVCGVVDKHTLRNPIAFKFQIDMFSKRSFLFVPPATLTVNLSRYEKILIAFWAGVAETKSVISNTGTVDDAYIRFLTKEQCIVLVENINNREVKVSCQPGCGATTLMLEVARRLSRLGKTLLVCESEEEKDRLNHAQLSCPVIGPGDVQKTELSQFENILDASGNITEQTCSRLWIFNQDLPVCYETIQHLEKRTETTQRLLYVMEFDHRQIKVNHLIQELDNLKSLETWVKLHSNLVVEAWGLHDLVEKQYPNSGDVDTRRNMCREMTEQFQEVLQYHGDLFPVLKTAMQEDKKAIFFLQAKTEYLEQEIPTEGKIGIWRQKRDSEYGSQHQLGPMEKTQPQMKADPELTLKQFKGPIQPKAGDPHLTMKQYTGILQSSKSNTDFKLNAEGLGGIQHIKARLQQLRQEAESQEWQFKTFTAEDRIEWEVKLKLLSNEITALSIYPLITKITGDEVIPASVEQSCAPNVSGKCLMDNRGDQMGKHRNHVHLLRKFQHGRLTRRNILDILDNVITSDSNALPTLQEEARNLEEVYGSPVYIVTEYGSPRSSLVPCPVMKLDKSRVNIDWCHVSTDGGTLVNTTDRGQYNTDSGQYNTDRFRRYYGTCSSPPIPLPPSPSTLTAPRYWESHIRLSVPGLVYGLALLEMGICGVGEVDTGPWVSDQTRSSWAVCVVECGTHSYRYCTQVWGEGRQVGGCYNTKYITHNTTVVYKYGVVLDVERGRVAFLDLDRDIVIEKMDVRITQPLRAMFGARPRDIELGPDCDIQMTLVSGGEIAMTDNKQSLICKALSV